MILEELKKFIEVVQEREDKIILIGHGLGGQIAWKFATKYPEMIQKFISISTPHPSVWLRNRVK